ncbi:hypothetical protein N4T56_10050 [Shewanella sp. KJ10-1]|uniref:Uncharacterized protein n=1 Tax=Shewanella phaeophyticola TaxID=2978345 RepID=A0ABT2P2Q3_9GAMM|nr:hypothetical protein [Shewanella sp. KJ10-1]MCT8986752.1 hypothetical protein [Shewanella sp. KJ10-1]
MSEQQIVDALNVLYLYLRQYVLKSNSKMQLQDKPSMQLNPLVQGKLVESRGDCDADVPKAANHAKR